MAFVVCGVSSFDPTASPLRATLDAATKEPGQWADLVPRRLRRLLSRRCSLDDENEGIKKECVSRNTLNDWRLSLFHVWGLSER